jgi:hypothetical protein
MARERIASILAATHRQALRKRSCQKRQSLHARVHNLPKICEPPQHSRRQKGDRKQVPCGSLRDIRRHYTNFSRLGDLGSRISTPLVLCYLLMRFVTSVKWRRKVVSSYCVKLEMTSRRKLVAVLEHFGCLFWKRLKFGASCSRPRRLWAWCTEECSLSLRAFAVHGPNFILDISFVSAAVPPCWIQLIGLI